MTVLLKFSNFAQTTIADTGGISAGATTVNVNTGDGSLFPSLSGSDYFYLVLTDASNNREVVKCTARSTDALTIVRAQDGSSARAFPNGSTVELAMVSVAMEEIQSDLDTAYTYVNNLTATYSEVNTACDGITATATEINTACDGITATASEINTACDGITATASEINTACDGILATASEINTACDGITATASEINTTCDGNTASAAEITAVCDGCTATAAEITTVCDGNTATAAEITAGCDGIGVSIPKTKIVSFSSWNMDTSTTKTAAHGIANGATKIIAVTGSITAATGHPIPRLYDAGGAGTPQCWVDTWDDTNVNLMCLSGGIYDNATYNNASGYLIVSYID